MSIPAKIDANDAVTGDTNSARAGARIEAQIANGIMTGKVWGQWCIYPIRLTRQTTKSLYGLPRCSGCGFPALSR